MTTAAKDIADHFINRAKNLEEFTVTVDVPEEFVLNGTIPFNMLIQEGVIYAKVWAVDFNEAVSRLDAWLEGCK
jgi:hypothetical protein